jgi:hypothetical protein
MSCFPPTPKHIGVPAHLFFSRPVETYGDDPVVPILERWPNRRVPVLLRRAQKSWLVMLGRESEFTHQPQGSRLESMQLVSLH